MTKAEYDEAYWTGYEHGENSSQADCWLALSEALDSDEDWPELIKEVARMVEERKYADPKW